MSERRCETCRWWMDGVRDMDGTIADCGGWGDCRKRAPTHNPNPENTDFPRSHQADWCGEHQPRPADE